MTDPQLSSLLASIAVSGTGGFLLSRLLARTRRTVVDNAAVAVTGVSVAALLCFVISLGWTLDWRQVDLITFAYCFFWDRGRMIREWFPEQPPPRD